MKCPFSHLRFLIQWNGRMGSDWWFRENSRNSESCVTRKDGELKQLDNRLSKYVFFSLRLKTRSCRDG
jgi:hypothetical protein